MRVRFVSRIAVAQLEPDGLTASGPDPEQHAYAGELRRLLEATVDALPEPYRLVFMLREIEGMSTTETAEGLGLGEEAVKTGAPRASWDGVLARISEPGIEPSRML